MIRTFLHVVLGYLVAVAIWTAIHFPYATDLRPSPEEVARARAFYEEAYAGPEAKEPAPEDEKYAKASAEAAQRENVKGKLAEFIRENNLDKAKALEVGAGHGNLQDAVKDYTGLDISASARKYFHKPFVPGSATALPFEDDRFDIVWSIWVLEHVPNPEQALREMRRVVKHDGILYLMPAWDVPAWAADGCMYRDWRDLDWRGKIVKWTIPLRTSPFYLSTYKGPVWFLRNSWVEWKGKPSTLRYQRLEPNYKQYWGHDSDAVNSLDKLEMLLWFKSRGDQCLNCSSSGVFGMPPGDDARLILRVRKR